MTDAPSDARRFAPATARNRDAILAVLRRVMPARGTVLEIASGSGEHAVHFAAALPQLRWQPTDGDPDALASIAAWRAHAGAQPGGAPNLLSPLALDIHATRWPIETVDAVFCANMIHIAPWSATPALMAGVARTLVPGGVLVLYGPFRRGGAHTADSNAQFDQGLRARDPSWGVRDLEAVADTAQAERLRLREEVAMPANNLSLVFERGV